MINSAILCRSGFSREVSLMNAAAEGIRRRSRGFAVSRDDKLEIISIKEN
jgi:hypothetical protein